MTKDKYTRYKNAANALIERNAELLNQYNEERQAYGKDSWSFSFSRNADADELELEMELMIRTFDKESPLLEVVSNPYHERKYGHRHYNDEILNTIDFILRKFLYALDLSQE